MFDVSYLFVALSLCSMRLVWLICCFDTVFNVFGVFVCCFATVFSVFVALTLCSVFDGFVCCFDTVFSV